MSRYPEAFLHRMQEMLGRDYEAFAASLEQPSVQGLRVNTLKTTSESFLKKTPFRLEPVPWVRDGYTFYAPDRPGKHPYHAAGVYYIQEPSAMSVAEVLNPQPGERVLDLCAAPGGKSTHLAALLGGRGLLVSNEPHPARAKILSENIERFGVRNAMVTNEMPDKLSARFPAFFDRILVDAPCSGEGMFRKDPDACDEWSPEHVTMCAVRQADILDHAALMLRPGGTMVYSTCTFSPDENEGTMEKFLARHPEFELIDIHTAEHFAPGFGEFAKTARLWPHKLSGEGHYVAHLRKTDDANGGQASDEHGGARKKSGKGKGRDGRGSSSAKVPLDAVKTYREFAGETLTVVPEGEFLLFGEQLYLPPAGLPDLQGLKVVRPGWHLGTVKKNRLEPSHHLALGLHPDEVRHTVDLAADDPQVLQYLRGDTLSVDSHKGWIVLTVDGFPLGWGKLSGGQLKNHYPKGLRWV
ncbi:RsmF rRNA methyltransferase first C-terminal domain-containing protein [Tumebacillus flagellatus]|uniref:SAM-dependent MTase RsmB/NOP-type domain-containing protein n=1 Tax=Tumebacillus flagellatus TaxID=1157490 RepID=A0A074LNY3_9BACL|nr:RsmB/NOP family class I SAM-dependent RNA methyltransferase [Tumebacillus flagellatus]KEO83881.1 hypothetical protein EL26_08175 [Tumebacillus flagellatus]